jgi:hypothetical protein
LKKSLKDVQNKGKELVDKIKTQISQTFNQLTQKQK